MIIDAHYHLEERLETVDRLVDQMTRHGIDRVALMAVQVDPFRMNGFQEALAGVMRKALMGRGHGIGLAMYNTTVTRGGKFSLLGKLYSIYPTPDNRQVARVMREYPDKFYGWIFVNPRAADPIDEMDKWVGRRGWIGVKCHPFWNRHPVSMLDDTAAYCGEKGLPLLAHLGGTKGRGDYKLLPERHPKTNFIYPHAAVPHYRRSWDYIRKKDNVFVDLSGPYCDEPMRRAAVRELGAEKCIFGTDGPYGYSGPDGLYDHGAILQEIDRLPISDSNRERILAGNFKDLMRGRES